MKMSKCEGGFKLCKPAYEEFICGEECERVKRPCCIRIPRGGEKPRYCPISGKEVLWLDIEKCCPICGEPMEKEELFTRCACNAEYYHYLCPNCECEERIIYDAWEPLSFKREEGKSNGENRERSGGT